MGEDAGPSGPRFTGAEAAWREEIVEVAGGASTAVPAPAEEPAWFRETADFVAALAAGREDDASTALVMSLGAVIVAPHLGQGADTPAKWVGTRNFASQCGQVNLIFFTSFRLSLVQHKTWLRGAPVWSQTTGQAGGLD